MGGMENDDLPRSHHRTRKVFLFANYILLGAASSCIFLVLSLRLIPSLYGFLLILLHLLTIAGAISGCAAASQGTSRWYGTHMVATVLTAIFQGSVSMLIFTRADDFLHQLRSYVREGDGVVILKLAGGLCVVIFCLEWVVLTLAFFLKYYDVVEGGGCVSAMKRGDKLQEEQMEGSRNRSKGRGFWSEQWKAGRILVGSWKNKGRQKQRPRTWFGDQRLCLWWEIEIKRELGVRAAALPQAEEREQVK
ncbi:hypothetical protein Nepgr_014895 [Nepenthes gracilis]|uniref:Uncharacterized protein n=1 Tax=Nepenthes gracilis TaxID=150966 RepID=A0AAD3SLZ0_NEPGR|nr:hypothetical protein Nepgr_014895 [Nepenthes gracilis]